MKAKQHLEQSMQEEQIREALNTHWQARQPAMPRRNTIFTMTMPFVIIPSQTSESSGGGICKPCEVTIPASRQASTSSEFSETVISGSRIDSLPGRPAYTVSIMEFRNERSCTRRSISRIPSRRPACGN